MDEFEIIKLNNMSHDYLVISKSTDDFIFFIDEIDKLIKEKNARILIDLIMKNGLQFNRFFEYNKPHKEKIKMAILTDIEEDIKRISINYFLKNEYLFEESALSKNTIILIKNIFQNRLRNHNIQ